MTPEQVNEIAQQLDCGFRCFWGIDNNEMIFIPDFDRNGWEVEGWEQDIAKIDNNPGKYFAIDPPESRDSFRIMADFAESLPDNEIVKVKLIAALNHKGPFSNFKFEIDNSGPYRQQWFDFKQKKLEEYVLDQVDMIISSQNFDENGIRI
jgi:hypothetical protein